MFHKFIVLYVQTKNVQNSFVLILMIFLFRYDNRMGLSPDQAKHWSNQTLLHSRARLRVLNSIRAELILDRVRPHDQGSYKCRVDFEKAKTRSSLAFVTVIGK